MRASDPPLLWFVVLRTLPSFWLTVYTRLFLWFIEKARGHTMEALADATLQDTNRVVYPENGCTIQEEADDEIIDHSHVGEYDIMSHEEVDDNALEVEHHHQDSSEQALYSECPIDIHRTT